MYWFTTIYNMKKILFVLLICSAIQSNAQLFLKGGLAPALYAGEPAIGGEAEVGIKSPGNLQLSIGLTSLPFADKAWLYTKAGILIGERFTVNAGSALINVTTDDPRKMRMTYIAGFEYNFEYSERANGRFYTGLDFSQNTVFLKFGLKWNYYSQ